MLKCFEMLVAELPWGVPSIAIPYPDATKGRPLGCKGFYLSSLLIAIWRFGDLVIWLVFVSFCSWLIHSCFLTFLTHSWRSTGRISRMDCSFIPWARATLCFLLFPVFVLHVMWLLILSWSIMLFLQSARRKPTCSFTPCGSWRLSPWRLSPWPFLVMWHDSLWQWHFSKPMPFFDPFFDPLSNECHKSRQDTSSVTMFALLMSRYVTEACTFCHNEHLRRPKRRSPSDMLVRGHDAFLHWQSLIQAKFKKENTGVQTEYSEYRRLPVERRQEFVHLLSLVLVQVRRDETRRIRRTGVGLRVSWRATRIMMSKVICQVFYKFQDFEKI